MEKENFFKSVFKKHNKQVYGYLIGKTSNKEIAEELLQETFLRIWKNIDNLINIEEEDQSSWIFKVAKNLLIDYYRKNNTRSNLYQKLKNETHSTSSFSDNPYDNLINNDQLQRLGEIIKKLPEKQKEILHMSVIGEMSSTKIGEILNMPAGTVRYKLHLARNNLKKELNKQSKEGKK
ncbi:MAG: RNA polymerase sigma factor [bacterium]